MQMTRGVKMHPARAIPPVPEARAVRCHHDEPPSRLQDAVTLAQQQQGVVYMLDKMAHRHGIECAVGKALRGQFADVDLHALRRRVPRCLWIEVDAFGVPAQLLHEPEQSTVAAADVEPAARSEEPTSEMQ